ncbi:MAG: signal peptidase I [Clostridia bacterium]|nr:signal peptidase I [Clostridia bacterium]
MNNDPTTNGEVTASEKKPGGAKKVVGIIVNVILWIFVIFSVIVTVLAFAASSSSDGIPSIGGKVISPVLSNSMADTINEGDIIFSRKLADEEKGSLKIGDIITFRADIDGDGQPEVNTHRIVEIAENGYYKTKGDNNLADDHYEVNPRDVISIFDPDQDTKIGGLGYVMRFLLTSTGFLVVIVIPLIIFFVYEIIVFVRKLNETKNAGKKQITAADEELIKQKAIEEYIRSQQESDNKGEPEAEEVKAEEEAPAEAEAGEAKAEEAPAEAEAEEAEGPKAE